MSFQLSAGTLVCQTGTELPEALAAPIIDRGDEMKVFTWDAGDVFQAKAFRRLVSNDRVVFVLSPESVALGDLAYAAILETPRNAGLFVERVNAALFADLISLARANGLVIWTEATVWLMAAWLCYDTAPLTA